MALSASASGLAFGANWPIAYSAAAATKMAEMTVVSKNARTLLRGGRLPAARLRCCDNAVLPWAERARPLRAKAASHAQSQPVQQPVIYRAEPPKQGANSVAAPRCQK